MKIIDLLTDETKWCQGVKARDAQNHAVVPTSPNAVRWCLVGAIERCYPNRLDQDEVYEKLMRVIDNKIIVIWNDDPKRKFSHIRVAIEKTGV